MGMVLPFQMPSAGGHILIDRALGRGFANKTMTAPEHHMCGACSTMPARRSTMPKTWHAAPGGWALLCAP